MKPPPFVATLHFVASLRTAGPHNVPLKDDYPLDLRTEWRIDIGYPMQNFSFPEGLTFCPATILKAFEPQPEPVLLLDDEHPAESVWIDIRDHDTRTITWYHKGFRGLVKSRLDLNEPPTWQELPSPIYFRKLSNRHVPEAFARTVRAFALAFPGRLRGDYSPSMRDAVSTYFQESLPIPWSQS